jgi:hypothetical protein
MNMRHSLLAAILAASLAASAHARITRTRPSPTQTWSSLTPITIGSGFEYESNDEGSEFHLPAFFEYNFSEKFRVSLETEYARTRSGLDAERSEGLGDLENSVDYEFLRERRYFPALTATLFARWPTASPEDIGDPGTDYGLGITASKDFIYFDLDLEVRHAFTTSAESGDVSEIVLAGESRLSRRFDLIAEIVQVIADENEFEATVGLAWHPNKFLTIESGVTRKDDGAGQLVLAWEYNFAGED